MTLVKRARRSRGRTLGSPPGILRTPGTTRRWPSRCPKRRTVRAGSNRRSIRVPRKTVRVGRAADRSSKGTGNRHFRIGASPPAQPGLTPAYPTIGSQVPGERASSTRRRRTASANKRTLGALGRYQPRCVLRSSPDSERRGPVPREFLKRPAACYARRRSWPRTGGLAPRSTFVHLKSATCRRGSASCGAPSVPSCGVADLDNFWTDFDYVYGRFGCEHTAAFAADHDGTLAGVNFATNWGSVGFFGPLAVRPDLWDKGIAQPLVAAVSEQFALWGTRHAGLCTFPQSTKHIWLYQKFGFYPRFLTAIMAAPAAASGPLPQDARYTALVPGERRAAEEASRALSDEIVDGLDLSAEIRTVAARGLGDALLLWERSSQLGGFAVCHWGPASEAGADCLFIKFGAVRPGPVPPIGLAHCSMRRRARPRSRDGEGPGWRQYRTRASLSPDDGTRFPQPNAGGEHASANEPAYSRETTSSSMIGARRFCSPAFPSISATPGRRCFSRRTTSERAPRPRPGSAPAVVGATQLRPAPYTGQASGRLLDWAPQTQALVR